MFATKMKIKAYWFYPLLGIFWLVSLADSSSLPSNPLIGIAPQDEKYFKAEIIKCKNGSKKFTKAQLNDDFCDCPDGTDEPGTSACPKGKFYCWNAGHVPVTLFSSRVNDGICDCCDGSDEYDGKVKCPNTCWEAGKIARDELKKKIELYQEGLVIRKQDVELAKQVMARDKMELSKLKSEEKSLRRLVKQLKARKIQVDKEEEREWLQKEKETMMREDATQKADQERNEAASESDGQGRASRTLDVESIGLSEKPPLNQNEKAEPETTEGLSREDLGRLVASRWTGEKAGHEVQDIGSGKSHHEDNNEIPESSHSERFDNSASQISEENNNDEISVEESASEAGRLDDSSASYKPGSEEDNNISDITRLSNTSWLDKVKETFWDLLQSVNLLSSPVDNLDADRVRKEYDESNTKLSDIQSRISSLTEKLKHDFGVEEEFCLFYDRCFEVKQSKYVYKVCPFKHASQEEGYSRTGLGNWDKFKDSYSVMLFSNGDGCWNGPDRSLKVKLRCGLKTEVIDVDEPSRCEYVATMSTPLLCLEGKLKELMHKLESMNKGEEQKHDEL